jgi:GNAT superfamily N-acetyltransferase
MDSSPLIGLSSVEAISDSHKCDRFRCGNQELDNWLRQYALTNEGVLSRTFVVHEALEVKGYYSLCTSSIAKTDAPPAALRHKLPRYPLPCMLLAKLARDEQYRSAGLGSTLLRDAILRVLKVAEDVGIFALLVDAIDERAALFYEGFGFLRFPGNANRLLIAVQDLRENARRP